MFIAIFEQMKSGFNQSWFKFLFRFTDLGRLLSNVNPPDAWEFFNTYNNSWWWNRLWFRACLLGSDYLTQFDILEKAIAKLKEENLYYKANVNVVCVNNNPFELANTLCALNSAGIANLENLQDAKNQKSSSNNAQMQTYKNIKYFIKTARNGNLLELNRLVELSPDKTQIMVRAYKFEAFRKAAANGHLDVMERLRELAPNDTQAMVSVHSYEVFRVAASNGHLHMMERLVELASANNISIQVMVCANNFKAFQAAAGNGHLDVMERLMALAPDSIQAMVCANNFEAFQAAAGNGHLDVMERLIALAPDSIQAMVRANDFEAFKRAAENGHLDVMERLMALAPDSIQAMVCANNFKAFSSAAGNGHLDVMERLMALAPDSIQAMVRGNDFEAFSSAARDGHLHVMERLIALSPNDIEAMVRAYYDSAFWGAALNGHLDVMDRLIALVPNRVQDLVTASNFQAFRRAAVNGHLHVIERLIALSPYSVQEMVRSHDFEAFRVAAFDGHLHVMERLIALSPYRVQDMVRSHDFEAFRVAAERGHLHMMERLIALTPNRVQEMVRASCLGPFGAFKSAAESGHLHVMERLMELSPNNVQEMVRVNNFGAFLLAAREGHLYVMERLMELSPDSVQDMVRSHDFGAFRDAAERGYIDVIERLIGFPEVFAYAEMHVREYGCYTQPFVNKTLESLQQQMNAFHIEHPNAVFDVTDTEKAKLYFYIMRNLIRQNTPESLNQLNLLLGIPSVKALAHTESNELLRLAMSLNNPEAAAILLNIPEVRILAEANDFYRQEQRGGLDLSAVARDRESSMRALTQGEQQRLESAQRKYQPEMNRRGVPAIMRELKNVLINRYIANPATVNTDDRPVKLPLKFIMFQELAKTLSADTREQALKSYYQHPDHTAYRYLSKPNPWMSSHAGYVNRDHTGAWSTFEEYGPFISLMYLAAKDESIPATNGYTIETRVENFIKELGLIGRAHNWDATRMNPTTGQFEEYDDLQGDKPSCYSGVKRRLFQSVQGHPLLELLTTDTLNQEVREIVREHFINRITDKNCVELNKAWEAIIDGDATTDTSILNELNFTKEELHQHIASISEKYGSKLDGDLMAYLHRTINVMVPFKNLAEKFGGETDLKGILEQKLATLPKKKPSKEEVRNARLQFFDSNPSSLDEPSSTHQILR